MRKVSLALLLTILVASTNASERAPYIFGPFANKLSEDDLQQIMNLVSKEGIEPWLLRVGCFLPGTGERWFSEVYLVPDHTTPRVRRGRMVTFFSDAPKPEVHQRLWYPANARFPYAQVSSSDEVFGPLLSEPSVRGRPFTVDGEISDEDLVGLIDFIRRSPFEVRIAPASPNDIPLPGVRVDGRLPVTAVSRTPEGKFRVVTEEREGAGQNIELSHQAMKWQVTKIMAWLF